MNLDLVQTREEAREAYADAIRAAKPGANLKALEARFNSAEAAYTQAKRTHDVAVAGSEVRSLDRSRTRVSSEPLTYERGNDRTAVARTRG